MFLRDKARTPVVLGLALLLCFLATVPAARAQPSSAPAQPLEARAFALSASGVDADRIEAARALADIGSAAAIDRLVILLEYDRAPAVRAAAARGFAVI